MQESLHDDGIRKPQAAGDRFPSPPEIFGGGSTYWMYSPASNDPLDGTVGVTNWLAPSDNTAAGNHAAASNWVDDPVAGRVVQNRIASGVNSTQIFSPAAAFTGWSLAVWHKFTAGGVAQTIATIDRFELRATAANDIQLDINNSQTIDLGISADVGNWHHWIAIPGPSAVSGGTNQIRLFRDNVEILDTTYTAFSHSTNRAMSLGTTGSGQRFSVSHWYPFVFSAAQRAALYNGGVIAANIPDPG